MNGPHPPQSGTSAEEMQLLQQLLAEEMRKAEASAIQQSQPHSMSAPAGLPPQLVAELQRQMIVPAAPTQRPQRQPSNGLGEWKWIGVAGMGCVTVLGSVWMIVASLPGARGTAELNTAVMALSDAAMNAQRPNITCIGFGCGKFGEAVAETQQPVRSVAVAPSQEASAQPFDMGYQKGRQEAPSVWGVPPDPQSQISKAEALLAKAQTPEQRGRMQAHIDYLRGL